jgi:hypothetical protein
MKVAEEYCWAITRHAAADQVPVCSSLHSCWTPLYIPKCLSMSVLSSELRTMPLAPDHPAHYYCVCPGVFVGYVQCHTDRWVRCK